MSGCEKALDEELPRLSRPLSGGSTKALGKIMIASATSAIKRTISS